MIRTGTPRLFSAPYRNCETVHFIVDFRGAWLTRVTRDYLDPADNIIKRNEIAPICT